MPAIVNRTTIEKSPPRCLKQPLFILLVGLLLWISSPAQDYSYVHYDIKDGLAGSTVYDLCQSKDGFIWFATDAGISRFDGTHFKNFTTADGLPESEILKVFADSKGRVWIAPFKKALCYYYQGKMNTADNNPFLKKLKLTAPLAQIVENAEGDILLVAGNSQAFMLPDHHKNPADTFINLSLGKIISASPNFTQKGFIIHHKDSAFIFQDNQLRFYYKPIAKGLLTECASYRNKKFVYIKRPPGVIGINGIALHPTLQKTLFINTVYGSWMIDSLRLNQYEELFLKGKQVSHAMVDTEKNIWFTTLGEGVYKLTSRAFKNLLPITGRGAEVFALEKHNTSLLAGMGLGWQYTLTGSALDSINFNKFLPNPYNSVLPNKLTCLKQLNDHSLILGLDGILLKKEHSRYLVRDINAIKSIEERDPLTILVATSRNALIITQKDLIVQDTIWPHRATAASYYNNSYHIGTTDGLYIVKKDKSVHFPGDSFPPLRLRISCLIKSADGSLWIATNGGGIVRMEGNNITDNITIRQGLNSDLCRTLFTKGNILWAGTNKGLNKINISKRPFSITSYSTSDGLPSDIINAIYVDSNKVYVGSPAGLTSFDESKVFNYSRCDLQLLDISVSGKSLPIKSGYTLDYRNNNLKVEFVAISFKSGGDILYRYRLKGLKDSWDSTRQNILEYPSLPSGEYGLELMAINKFGVLSNTIIIPVVIETPFWQTWWFRALIIALAIIMTAALVTWRFTVLRRREREKTSLQQKINDLEQLALRAQMNPHFIFNCLNSIQNFIISSDLETTNQYLTEFAYLIRQTLDSAEDGTISIDKEVKYLTRYIELERMRFGNSFDYVIEVDPKIDKDHIHIPSMILQPYVENGIRHGIRYKTDGKGMIRVIFQQDAHQLLCIVEDNGIGRQQAGAFKSKMHVEYQSKGMSLTAARIKALNRQYHETVVIEVTDLTDDRGQAAGTRISMLFPDKMIIKLS